MGALAAFWIAREQGIPTWIAAPVAIAFLMEVSLYLGVVQVAGIEPWMAAASALVAYFAFALPTQRFSWLALATLTGLALAACYGLRLLPPSLDLLFLVFMGAVFLAKPFGWIYPEPMAGLRVDALGQLMWIRLGIGAFLRDRPELDTGFGFLPARKDWIEGARYFLLFLVPGMGAALLLRYVSFGLAEGWWWKGPATFAAFLWVGALSEEFFFRGVMQPKLGLAATSMIFGLVHLPFREFPNWKHVMVATVLGYFCGLAYQKTGAIRAPIVTHALVVAIWRAFFR